MREYLSIINHPHYELRYHPRMSRANRAAQFAPFDALTGYKEELGEVRRQTTKRKVLLEDEHHILNHKLQSLDKNNFIQITYFVPDSNKLGGSYQKVEGQVKRIDEANKIIVLKDKKKIRLEQIIDIQEMKEYDKIESRKKESI